MYVCSQTCLIKCVWGVIVAGSMEVSVCTVCFCSMLGMVLI